MEKINLIDSIVGVGRPWQEQRSCPLQFIYAKNTSKTDPKLNLQPYFEPLVIFIGCFM
jgi:hypothetical protein